MHQLAGRNLCLIPVVSVLVDAVRFVIQYDDQRRKYSMQNNINPRFYTKQILFW
jgi:hypothetical protein